MNDCRESCGPPINRSKRLQLEDPTFSRTLPLSTPRLREASPATRFGFRMPQDRENIPQCCKMPKTGSA